MGQGCLPTRPRETVACGQHNPLAAADQVPRKGAPDLAYSNDYVSVGKPDSERFVGGEPVFVRFVV